MKQPTNAPLILEIAREVCDRTGAAAVLEGSITSFGSRYVLGLRAENCRTGKIIDEEQVQAAKKEDVLNVLSRIAATFRTRVGESLATVQELETPLPEATTHSLEALKQYSAALKTGLSPDPSAAVPLLQRAIEIDPSSRWRMRSSAAPTAIHGSRPERRKVFERLTNCGSAPVIARICLCP